jgi:DNA modification methylase
MTEFYRDEWLTILQGDVRDVLPTLASESVDCIVTSPPYWGLRDYGNDGQIGLERTPEEYVANMVGVFRELRRVLKPSGTCWLNLGDSYAAARSYQVTDTKWRDVGNTKGSEIPSGLKPKDLVGIPWRVAFALQADGWYLRSDIIWAKPNPMPESVTDRPTKAHEYLFLLTKSARYYFDADAVREDAKPWNGGQVRAPKFGPERMAGAGAAGTTVKTFDTIKGANLRSVWTIATRPYPGAHFAVFPPELPERCIKAGCPELGTVLDPFAGSGTTGMVANRLSRRAILIDLNASYLRQQMERNAQTPLGLGAA